jgi:hypothetical protein
MESSTAISISISSKSPFKTCTQQIKLLDLPQGTLTLQVSFLFTLLDLKKLYSKSAIK